jgi:hypothetical protein
LRPIMLGILRSEAFPFSHRFLKRVRRPSQITGNPKYARVCG